MLNYVITVAISVIFVPHYLSIFWEPLRTTPWDVIVGIAFTWLLVGLNVVGIKEAAGLNVLLAVLDFATQLLLVGLGFGLIFSAHIITSNIHFGVAPTWSNFALAIPVAMIAYTGIETVSNLAEEARDPLRSVPRAISWVAVAVFAIYFTLPWVALSAMPVVKVGGQYVTKLGQAPADGGFKNDPVLGLVENLGLHGTVLSAAKIYVGILAATILFIATNAGVIGASRITYSMASYRQLPEVFRRLHPKLKTPWLSLIVFAGIAPTLFLLSGKVDFLGRMYAFGAMLSFTIAHVSVTALRAKKAEGDEPPWHARPNFRFRGVDWPLFAIVGGFGTGAAWLVVVVQSSSTRYAGLGWLALGFVFYVLYRRRLGAPLRQTVRAPIVIVAGSLEYRNILVPIAPGYPSDEAMQVACRLADERRASIVAETVIEVPLELPLDAYLPEQVSEANEQLDEASAIGELYGVRVTERIVRARNAGRAIVDEATRRGSEIIVMGGPRRVRLTSGKRAIFGDTVDFVLKHAPCRVMVAASKDTVT
jgi:APA family basic amino acid/polyamine antiporter